MYNFLVYFMIIGSTTQFNMQDNSREDLAGPEV